MSAPKTWPELPVALDEHGLFIHDANGSRVVDIRGWGRLTGLGHGAMGLPSKDANAIQHAVGRHIVAALNAGAEPVPEPLPASPAGACRRVLEDILAGVEEEDARREPVIGGDSTGAVNWLLGLAPRMREAIAGELRSDDARPCRVAERLLEFAAGMTAPERAVLVAAAEKARRERW